MKHSLTVTTMNKVFLLFMLCTALANAQITVNNTDMPVRGDTVRYSVASTVDVASRLSSQ